VRSRTRCVACPAILVRADSCGLLTPLSGYRTSCASPSCCHARLSNGATLAPRAIVVSFSHELLVDFFRVRGELAPTLLRLCKGIVLDHTGAAQTSIDLSQVASTEYRADAVVVLRDASDAAVAALIVEVQLGIDPDKKRTWPVYVTTLHHKLDCPGLLVVVTPSERVARWASQPIPIGHPGFCLEPIVIELHSVPRVVEPTLLQALPELGVLSTLANPDFDVAIPALSAASGLPEDRAKLYCDVIMAALPLSIREALEAQMQGYVYQSEFARRYVAEGRSQGLEEGRLQGLRRAVLACLRLKLPVVSSDDEAVLAATTDEHALDELLHALLRATSESEVRTALAASCNRG
jgi:hypothetical protein